MLVCLSVVISGLVLLVIWVCCSVMWMEVLMLLMMFLLCECDMDWISFLSWLCCRVILVRCVLSSEILVVVLCISLVDCLVVRCVLVVWVVLVFWWCISFCFRDCWCDRFC